MSKQMMTLELGLNDAGLSTGCSSCAQVAECGCGCDAGGSGAVLERPRWFAGQLVGPADLEALSQWVIGRSRRHNRMLHGWGVSCGFAVTAVWEAQAKQPTPWILDVSAGFGLSACGDDISSRAPVHIDIRQPQPSGTDVCAPPVDPWCAPVRQRRDPDRTYYLAVRYAEESRRPVKGAGCGCGCGDDACEYTRIGEGYALAVLDELPAVYRGDDWKGHDPNMGLACTPELRQTGTRSCPSACSPWLILADLTVTSAGIITVDMLAHRRFLDSLPELAFSCQAVQTAVSVGFNAVEKNWVKQIFAESAETIADTSNRSLTLAVPASSLRGAGASKALKDLIGNQTIAELAQTDLSILTQRATAVGASTRAVANLHELASAAVRLAKE